LAPLSFSPGTADAAHPFFSAPRAAGPPWCGGWRHLLFSMDSFRILGKIREM
jgi:hypothetical protein